MKPVSRVLDVASNIEGEKIAMSIDTSAFAHIMSVLTDLYSDPELAVIREYSTNAYDAHIEFGIDRPIEVTLPTQLSLNLRIRDYGEGLDRDDIAEIYSQYGASTKRGSNDVVGMLGLGCKSALTYTDQFTVTGWKNGICTQISVSRDEDGSGSMTILDQFESDEHSGVEISVPAKTYHKFEEKANSFFKYWEKGTVLVNGETPESIRDAEGIWLNDNLFLTKDKRIDKPVVVMGNVAYPLPTDNDNNFIYGNYSNSYKLVAFVGIGEVQFVPSREALQMTPATKATINKLYSNVASELTRVLTERISRASSKWKAIKALFEARELINMPPEVKWNGNVIPLKFDKKFVLVNVKDYHSDQHKYYRRRSKGWEVFVDCASNNEYVWIYGYNVMTFTPHKRLKLEKWCENKGIAPHHVALCDELPQYSSWIPNDRKFDWQEVKDTHVDIDTVKTNGGRLTGSYDFLDKMGRSVGIPANDLALIHKPNLYWVTPQTKAEINSNYNRRWSRDSAYDPDGVIYRELFFEIHPDATLVLLPRNRVEKFKRDFPHARNMQENLREEARKWAKSVKSADKLTYYLQEYGDYYKTDYSILKWLPEEDINDPYLKRLVKHMKRDVTHIKSVIQKWGTYADFETESVKPECPYVKYPLLSKIDLTDGDGSARVHAILYVNAVHAAGKVS